MQAEYWKLEGDTYALYTYNQNVIQAARQASLAVTAEYVKGGDLIAVQFSGPKATITEITKKKFGEKPVKEAIEDSKQPCGLAKKKCSLCGKLFEARSNAQAFCDGCRSEGYRKTTRNRVSRHRSKTG